MNNPVQEIKEKLDIVDIIKERIPLTPAGKNFKAVCPFHKEKTPSFMVSPDRQTWHCFGSCGEGGDVFSFVMKYDNIEFYEALKLLAEKAGIELKQISPSSQKEFGVLFDINNLAKDFFRQQLTENQEANDYLESRQLNKEILEEFEIGFAPNAHDALCIYLANLGYDMVDSERAGLIFKNDRGTYQDRFRGRVMFPLYNTFGKVVGFSGRIMPKLENDNIGKYINSPETLIFNKSKILYGFHVTKPFMKSENEIIMVEGQMDFLSLFQDGVKNAVAVSGTALTQDHLGILKRISENMIIGFDNDEAGLNATQRAIDLANTLDFNVKVFVLEEAKDAAEFVSKNPGKIKGLISKSISALDFYYKRFFEKEDGQDLKNQTRKMLEKISLLLSPIEKSRWIKYLSEKTHISEKALWEEMDMRKKKSSQTKQSLDEVPIQTVKETTRMEKLSWEVLTLTLIDKNKLGLLDDSLSYFPDQAVKVVEYFKNPQKDSEVSQLASDLEMKASLKAEQVDKEKLDIEIVFLLRELKREFYKKRRELIQAQMKEKEKEGDMESVSKLNKEFDEVTKLSDN
ncbi:MAG: DNA primase [Candidatus Paceibacterota bacterium]|jgi:DNA primase